MADGKILAEDLIDVKGIQESITEIQNNLGNLKTSLQSVTKDLQTKINIGGGEELKALAPAIQSLADAMTKLKTASDVNKQAMAALKNETVGMQEASKQAVASDNARAASLKAEAAELNRDTAAKKNAMAAEKEHTAQVKNGTVELSAEVVALKELIATQNASAEALRNASNAVQVQGKSFNELSASYGALKKVMNDVNVDMINSSETGYKAVQEKLAQLYEAMNKYQQSTGKWQMNVGQYRTAFDGLGFSIQQVLREVPSALNVQQFFLAISNNIPMVVDQMKMFNVEQQNIKKNLEEIEKNEGKASAAYEAMANKQISMGKKIAQSIFNWQTALLAVLMLLRTYGADIIQWVKELFTGVKNVEYRTSALTASVSALFNAFKAVINKAMELSVIQDKLKTIKKGTEDWRVAIAKVSEITGKNLDYTTATIEQVKKVTEAYKQQAFQLAINEQVVEKLAKGAVAEKVRESASKSNDVNTVASLLGISEGSDEYKKLNKLMKKAGGDLGDYNYYKSFDPTTTFSVYPGSMSSTTAEKKAENAWEEYTKSQQRYIEFIRKKTSNDALTDDAKKTLEEMYKMTPELSKSSSGSSRSSSKNEPTIQSATDRYWESEEALINAQQQGYDKEYALALLARDKALEVNEDNWDEQLTKLDENLANKFITQEEYDKQAQELERQHNNIQLGIYKDYQEKHDDITAKLTDEQYKARQKYETENINSLTDAYDHQLVAVRKRVKSAEDERDKNAQLIENIETLRKKMAALRAQETTTTESTEEQAKAIGKTTEEIKKLQSQMSASQQMKHIGSVSDLISSDTFVGDKIKSNKSSFYEKYSGKSAVGAKEDDINTFFDNNIGQWSDRVKEEWGNLYNSVKDSVSDLLNSYIDAWVEYYNKKNELAEEDVDTAKTNWETQQELLANGYASSVETAWKEYNEKKAIQEQTEKDAERAQKTQSAISSLESGASLSVAIANIIKLYSGVPLGGLGIAASAIAGVLAMYASYQAQIKSVASYGEGMAEYVEGGSHSSGHDVSMAYDKQGRERRVEGGEEIAVFNKRAVTKYGRYEIESIIKEMNALRYEERESGAIRREERMTSVFFPMRSSVNLGRLESGVSEIARQGGERSYVDGDGNLIEIRKNFKRKTIKA